MKYLLLITTILLATACHNCPDKHFVFDDTDLLPYKKGTKLIYKSDLSNYDTLVIDSVIDETFFYSRTDTYCRSGHQDTYTQVISYYIHKKKFTCDTPFITFSADGGNGGAIMAKELYPFTVTDFYINDSVYNEVQYYAYDRDIGGDTLRSFVFTNTDGIIFFEKNDGEKFYFVKSQ